jgi:Yip1-like protein
VEQAVAVSEQPAPERGFFAHLGGLLFSPGAEFKSIVSRPRFWAPLLVGAVLTLGFTVIWTGKVDPREFFRNQMEQSPRTSQMPPDQMERVITMQSRFFRPASIFFAVVGGPIFTVVMSLIYLFVFRFIYGSQVTFRQSLTIICWTYLVIALVTTPLILLVYFMKGDWNLTPDVVLQANLAALLDRQKTARWLYTLASSIDLFEAWRIALLSLGFGAAMRRPASAALGGILGLWALYVLVRVALAAVL